jgi:hypothetical protein
MGCLFIAAIGKSRLHSHHQTQQPAQHSAAQHSTGQHCLSCQWQESSTHPASLVSSRADHNRSCTCISGLTTCNQARLEPAQPEQLGEPEEPG